jgi:hypothetical protein
LLQSTGLPLHTGEEVSDAPHEMTLKCKFTDVIRICLKTSLSPSNDTFNQGQTTDSQEMAAAIRNLRNKPDFLFVRLPNILSLICIVVGVVWLLLLPLNDYSRNTYISENALLPGQVHAYFTGSEQNIFRGYKKELEVLLEEGREEGVSRDLAVTPAYAKSHS